MVVLSGILANVLLAAGAWWLVRGGLRLTRRLDAGLGAAMIAFAWVVLGMEVLGTLGWLRPAGILGWSGLLAAGGLLIRRRRALVPAIETDPGAPPAVWRIHAILAIGLTLWACAVLCASSLLLPVKVMSDAPIYHLYFAVRWWKAGQLFLVPVPFGENAATYFPANGDLWFTWLTIAWGGDRLARVGQAPFLVIAALASFAIARRLGAGRDNSAVAACWFVTSTPFLIFSFEANVDTIFIASYLCAIGFFAQAAFEDEGRAGRLGLAGLAAGLALGTKSVGIVFVTPVIVLAMGAVLIKVRPMSHALGLAGVIGLTALAGCGYWYGRNWLVTGNPIYPLTVKALGRTVFPGAYDAAAMRRSIYYIPREDLRAFGDIMLAVLDPRMAPVWLAAILGAWHWRGTVLRESILRDRWTWVISGLAVLNVALYWLFIPYRTQQRFMLQALGLAAAPLARTFDRKPAILGPLGVILLAFHLLTPLTWPIALRDADIPWDMSPFIPNSIEGPLRVLEVAEEPGRIFIRPAPLMMLVLSALTACCAGIVAWGAARSRPAMAAAAAAGLVASSAFGTGAIGVDSRLLVYPGFRDFYAGWMNLEGRSGPDGSRIAYAGTNIPYYLFGAGLRNEVLYVNVDRHRDWLLHDYQCEATARGESSWPSSRPGWDRANPDYDAWLANLDALRIQLLVVTRVNAGEGPHNIADAEHFPMERVWADRHPERFEPLYGPSERDGFFRIYRLRPASR
ncbi:phospholipid carrier-dependent glycosyltransferase [Aquisphaera insulae]|uniref:phospholipid carrier-dependent glycosyltransferase n=1 Tax=Aquisphaera insulae TaxID=2712864 RepID=UPI0013E9B7F8|nr:phospholipid carrier-dependent glycosyltransferase [Aquisphaera insulae]